MRFRFNEKKIGLFIIAVALVRLGMVANEAPTKPKTWLVQQSVTENRRIACRVLTVYDGDTLGCDLNGNGRIERPTEEVRLLGVDTPEMHYSRKNKTHDSVHPTDEPFAKEASRWMETHAVRKTVYLEFDERKEDRYHRTLAFVYPTARATLSLNAELLRLGYAKMLFLGRNRLHETEFQAIENQARMHHDGIWHIN